MLRGEAWMRLIGSSDVLRLTGLTADQLREWTGRRALILPDVPASKRGVKAQYSWQTVLVLRLAVVMRVRFHVELQAHRDLLAEALKLIRGTSFPALWGTTLAIYDLRRCELFFGPNLTDGDVDALFLHLNEHLDVLSRGFELSDPMAQLPLFPAVPIKRSGSSDNSVRIREGLRS